MLFHNLPVDVVAPADPRHPDLHAYWNLWSRRLFPFHDLTAGDRVALVQTGGSLSDSLVTWLVEVDDVVAEPYRSHTDAAAMVDHQLGISRVDFLHDVYTAGRPADGVMLAWVARPLAALNLARPPEVRFRRQGWTELDDRVAHRILGLPALF